MDSLLNRKRGNEREREREREKKKKKKGENRKANKMWTGIGDENKGLGPAAEDE